MQQNQQQNKVESPLNGASSSIIATPSTPISTPSVVLNTSMQPFDLQSTTIVNSEGVAESAKATDSIHDKELIYSALKDCQVNLDRIVHD